MENLEYYRLLCSVGEGGNNLPADVKAIKLGLQKHRVYPPSPKNGLCDTYMIYAIREFHA
jgi:hypothetical protein